MKNNLIDFLFELVYNPFFGTIFKSLTALFVIIIIGNINYEPIRFICYILYIIIIIYILYKTARYIVNDQKN